MAWGVSAAGRLASLRRREVSAAATDRPFQPSAPARLPRLTTHVPRLVVPSERLSSSARLWKGDILRRAVLARSAQSHNASIMPTATGTEMIRGAQAASGGLTE